VHPRFHELVDELGGDWMRWDGTLAWGAPDERESIHELAETCLARGVALEILGADDVRRRFPGIDIADDDEFVYEAESGWVDAPALISRLLDRFIALGGELREHSPVVDLIRAGERVVGAVTAAGDRLEADIVINAAGSWGSHIAALAGAALPLDLVPGLMIYTHRIDPAALPATVLNSPTWLLRPEAGGGFAIHWRGSAMTGSHGANGWSAERIIQDVASTVPALSGVGVAETRVGIRPIPPGGPIVGALPWLPGLYHVLSHGGIGWGPLWADVVAREVLGGEQVTELASMRPDRFYLQTAALGRFADDAEQPELSRS
jgi:glycine/D-amino acid oxidase-like deaminating enzyme